MNAVLQYVNITKKNTIVKIAEEKDFANMSELKKTVLYVKDHLYVNIINESAHVLTVRVHQFAYMKHVKVFA